MRHEEKGLTQNNTFCLLIVRDYFTAQLRSNSSIFLLFKETT